MASGLQEEAARNSAAATDGAAGADGVDGHHSDQPNFIPTPAGEHAPRGRIYHDPVRGTIFWEIDPANDKANGEVDGEADGDGEASHADGNKATSAKATSKTKSSATNQHLGRPFAVQWLCVRKLPFIKTRGLKNPWNATREVKVARDGTELEPEVGRRLIALFNIR